MVVQVRYVRPPTVGLPQDDWYDEALCRGLPTELFELQDFDEVERGEQEEKIAEGLRICSGCPVRAACKGNSTELDRYWTTRGGQPPEGLFLDSKMPKYKLPRQVNGYGQGEGPVREPKKKCKRGHENWFNDNKGNRRCMSCRVEDNRNYKLRQKAKREAFKESQADA